MPFFSLAEFMSFLDSKNVSNMLFTFRWLLINFKREFDFESVKTLWEVGFDIMPGFTSFHRHLLFR